MWQHSVEEVAVHAARPAIQHSLGGKQPHWMATLARSLVSIKVEGNDIFRMLGLVMEQDVARIQGLISFPELSQGSLGLVILGIISAQKEL